MDLPRVSLSEYEKTSYYNGITGDADHPNLVYRSDFLTTPFPKPVGRHASLLLKLLRGVFGTPLNGVWDSVGPQIIDLLNARKIDWTSVGSTTFKFPYDRKLRIEGCATKEDLSHPAEFDNEGQHCLMVGKNGNTTDLTIGRYAGLVSFTRNQAGIESIELGIYNSGDRFAEPFSAKGDSGSLVWHSTNDKTRIVGQIHSGQNKGGSTSNHVTYCTPGWYLLSQIQKRFKYADFYRTTWSA